MGSKAFVLVVASAAVLLAAAAGAAGQAQPTDGGPFANFQESQLVFSPPSNVTQVNGAVFDMIDGLKTANLAQVIFSLEPCTFFTTHFHPNGTEVMTGIQGQLEMFIFLNGQLLHVPIQQLDTVVLPQGTVHFYFNNQCQQTITQSSLNSATPGAFFYNSPTPALLGGSPSANDVQQIIATQVPAPMASPTPFTPITNGCQARCAGVAPAASAANAGAAAGRRLRLFA